MYLDENEDIIKNISTLGPLSAGIPGIPAVLSYVNDKYGSKKLSTLLDPAYKAAINGFSQSKICFKKLFSRSSH